MYCPQEMHFNYKDIENERVIKKADMALLVSGQVAFSKKYCQRQNETFHNDKITQQEVTYNPKCGHIS